MEVIVCGGGGGGGGGGMRNVHKTRVFEILSPFAAGTPFIENNTRRGWQEKRKQKCRSEYRVLSTE